MAPRSIKLAGATAAAGLAALTLAQVGAEVRARAAIAQLIGTRPGLTVAAATADVFGGVRLDGVEVSSPGLHLRIGTLAWHSDRGLLSKLQAALVSPAQAFPSTGGNAVEAPAAPASAPGIATAEKVVIDYQGVTYTIPRIEVAGTTLNDADLAAMLDVNSADSVETRLRRFSAASVTMPEIKADTATGDFEQHWDQQQVLFASVTNGKAAVGSAGPGTLKTTSAKGTTVAETGGLQMTGIDMGQIVHVAVATRADNAEPQQVLAQSLVLSAIKLDGGDGTVITLASLKEAGLRARPLTLNSQARSLLLSKGKPGDPAVDAFVGDIASSISFDLLQADDLVITPKDTKEATLRLARATVTDVHDRGIGAVALQQFRADQAENHLTVGTAELKALVVPETLDGKATPTFGRLDFADLALDVDIEKTGQPEQRLKATLARAAFSAPGAKAGALPPQANLTLDKLSIVIPPSIAPNLAAMGYSTLGISSTLTTSFDAKAQALNIDDWTLNGVDMGKAALKLQLGKATDALASPDDETRKAAAAAIVFKGIDLAINDAGLVDRALAYRAAQDGMSVAQEREQAIDLVRNKLPVLAGDPAKLKPVEDAVARFIADPKLPLHLVVTSPSGLGAADSALLGDPNALLDRMSIVATAGP